MSTVCSFNYEGKFVAVVAKENFMMAVLEQSGQSCSHSYSLR
jgi:hypothetical protein